MDILLAHRAAHVGAESMTPDELYMVVYKDGTLEDRIDLGWLSRLKDANGNPLSYTDFLDTLF